MQDYFNEVIAYRPTSILFTAI